MKYWIWQKKILKLALLAAACSDCHASVLCARDDRRIDHFLDSVCIVLVANRTLSRLHLRAIHLKQVEERTDCFLLADEVTPLARTHTPRTTHSEKWDQVVSSRRSWPISYLNF